MVDHLRKSFPAVVDSSTVKKLGLASNNESYVINALQFVGVIDEVGKKTKEATEAFASHKDEDFEKHFSNLVKVSYSELFELRGDGAWALSKDDLITFFRQTDDTSAVIGGRQAGTFQVLAALAGHGEVPAKKESGKAPSPVKQKAAKATGAKKPATGKLDEQPTTKTDKRTDVGLSVRVEINLPSDGTKETYDHIFKSIRENLIDG